MLTWVGQQASAARAGSRDECSGLVATVLINALLLCCTPTDGKMDSPRLPLYPRLPFAVNDICTDCSSTKAEKNRFEGHTDFEVL